MYGIIKLGTKYGWYMYDDAGNTTKEGKELFDTEDECQAFTDKLGGKTDATVEIESDPMYLIIKLGNKFGWYQTDENGNTVMEGSEVFARHSEAQKFLNEKFPAVKAPAPAPIGSIGLQPVVPEAPTASENAGDATQLNATSLSAFVADKDAMAYPYTFTEADIERFTALFDNGFRAGDEAVDKDALVAALTVKA